MLDPKQPLWLPAGSVRSLLAFLVVGSLIVVLSYLAIAGKVDADQAFVGLLGLVTLVLNAYFLSKRA